tara:strand:+ start:966 stop:1307 length:342 start_codon:yes stop_codon:yes gene_type:complete
MSSDIPTLDLHGIKHEEVEANVQNFVVRQTPCRIITGNSYQMSILVQKTLRSMDISWISFGGNLGYLFIPDVKAMKNKSDEIASEKYPDNINEKYRKRKLKNANNSGKKFKNT